MGAFNPQMAPYPGAPLGGPLYAPVGQMLPNPYAGDPSQYGAGGAYGVGGTDAVAAATALGMMNAASGGMHNPMAGAAGGAQQTQPHLQRQALSQMHPPKLAAAARAYRPAGAAGVGSMDPTAVAFHNPQLAGNGNGRGTPGAGGSHKFAESHGGRGKAKSGGSGSSAADADEPDGSSHPRGLPLRTPSGGGLPRPGTGTSATYARAKHAQLTLKDLAQARDLMVQEIESKGESSQSALKDLGCILKQMIQ